MLKLLQYYGQWQGFRSGLGQLPSWARFAVLLAALPGIVLIGLSILAFLVSLLALLLLTVPVFRAVSWLCGVRPDVVSMPAAPDEPAIDVVIEDAMAADQPRPPRRQIDVRIVE